MIGTGKTLLARAVASQLDANFLKVVSSAIVDKYIGMIYILLCHVYIFDRHINWQMAITQYCNYILLPFRGKCSFNQRDVQLCPRSSTMHNLYG